MGRAIATHTFPGSDTKHANEGIASDALTRNLRETNALLDLKEPKDEYLPQRID